MVYVNELPFFGGAVGSLSTFSVSWPFADMDGPVFTEAALFHHVAAGRGIGHRDRHDPRRAACTPVA